MLQFNQIIESCDVLDDEGMLIELDEKFLRQLSVAFLTSVITAVSSEMNDIPKKIEAALLDMDNIEI